MEKVYVPYSREFAMNDPVVDLFAIANGVRAGEMIYVRGVKDGRFEDAYVTYYGTANMVTIVMGKMGGVVKDHKVLKELGYKRIKRRPDQTYSYFKFKDRDGKEVKDA